METTSHKKEKKIRPRYGFTDAEDLKRL